MADWHQACCRKRPLRAKPSADQQTYPHGDFEDENKIAARGAAVSKNASINRLSPRRTTDCVPFMIR